MNSEHRLGVLRVADPNVVNLACIEMTAFPNISSSAQGETDSQKPTCTEIKHFTNEKVESETHSTGCVDPGEYPCALAHLGRKGGRQDFAMSRASGKIARLCRSFARLPGGPWTINSALIQQDRCFLRSMTRSSSREVGISVPTFLCSRF